MWCDNGLKECISSYNDQGSNVFICFKDATKAFDRVNHGDLLKLLCKKKVPRYIVCILHYWYSNQTGKVKWDNSVTTSFSVTNGV